MDPLTMMAIGSNLLGGFFGNKALAGAQKDIKNMAAFNPWSAGGGFGNYFMGNGSGTVTDSLAQQGYRQTLAPGIGAMSMGGLFNDPNLQAAWGANDIAGAMNNPIFNQQIQANALSGAGTLTGLGEQLAAQAGGGMQDQTGGIMGDLFTQGVANQLAAGDMTTLQNQELATMRAAAQPEMDRQFNKLQNRLFATGQLGSTGGGEQLRGLMEAQGAQDLGFQQEAFGRAAQRSGLLSQLGLGQTGQASGLLGQNLGQYNQNISNAQALLQGGASLENQLFQNQLASLGQAQSAGQNRVSNALNLFGLGGQTFMDSFNAAQGGIGTLMGIDALQSQHLLGLLNAEANRIGATQGHAQGLASSAQSQGGLLGGIFSGIGKIFSDERLKDNVEFIEEDDAGNRWYKWEWNSQAKLVGAHRQPNVGVIAQEVEVYFPEAVVTGPGGFKMVDYGALPNGC